jgi:ankyrin repeat protein
LHAAVNKGKLDLVEILLNSLSNNNQQDSSNKQTIKLDINRPNEKCMDATPLHLAVWNDYNEIALVLLQASADPYLKMNGKNALEMAKDNSNEILYDLIGEYSQIKSNLNNNNNRIIN